MTRYKIAEKLAYLNSITRPYIERIERSAANGVPFDKTDLDVLVLYQLVIDLLEAMPKEDGR